MRTTKLTRFVRSTWNRAGYVFATGFAFFLVAMVLFADPPDDPPLKVLKMGLGSGIVTSSPAGINCGPTCEAGYAGTDTVTLTATADAGSTFAGWDIDPDADAGTTPDCTGLLPTCTLSMSVARSVRPVFDLTPAIPTLASFTPEGIQTYLTANTTVNTAARFVKALPAEYKQNWLLMSRSESLQTGTAEMPRILLPSANAQLTFTLGLAEHSSYPGAHPHAIEYMQWDPAQKNFRFHEVVLEAIQAMDPDGDGVGVIPARSRGVSIDDAKCPKCHSTRNVVNLDRSVSPAVPGSTIGTDGIPPGSVKAKNKPNWDTYDSWGGLLPFNRDRIYQGSVEAAAFRKFFNPWTWSTNDAVRKVIEQLKLQPAGVPAADVITRLKGGANDGILKFAFDTSTPVLTEPAPAGSDPSITTAYSFDRIAGVGTPTTVLRGGSFLRLHHSDTPTSDEGRAVQFFDLVGGADGDINPQRIADELINHRWATGSVPIDVRPMAMAITKGGCLARNSGSNTVNSLVGTALTIDLSFFTSRNGLSINDVFADTERRAGSIMPETRSRILPRRKADIEKLNLDRTGDVYLWGNPNPSPAVNGLIQQYGSGTSAGTDTSMTRLRQEVFRRSTSGFQPDSTVMAGIYVDRELYTNTEKLALYRYFLEPMGVSVDKWSMGVRGRSRAYNFADVFGSYLNVFEGELRTSLTSSPVGGITNPDDCDQLITAINSTFSSLPDADGAGAIPKYTDVQRIFNKSCIECHGGLDYPPYQNYGSFLDLSENETPPAGDDRLDQSYDLVTSAYVTTDPNTSFLYQRITATNENCPFGLMPCGGPPLSKTDIETIRRWIVGGAPNTRGDPHIVTIDGQPYDFQSAGEFVLLRGQNLEVQARQTAVGTDGPLPPNNHTGLRSCVSLNTAAAVRVNRHRITYQPNSSGEPDPQGLQLRIDGKLSTMSNQGIPLESGGRIIQTSAPGGIQIEAPGGTVVVITPNWWHHYQVWYLDIDVRHARATDGVMGAIAPGSWLPALPDGSSLGPKPRDLHQRYVDLYDKFENAWRVNNASALFDYAPGTSTSNFTIDSWPAEDPQVCTAPPRQAGGPVDKAPLKRLSLEVAQQHCGAIAGKIAKENCIQDVMVTGEPAFAQGYLKAEQIERNEIPTPPVLGFPENFKTDLAAPVDFTWNKTADKENDPLSYRHCVWEVKERFNFSKCVVAAAPGQTTSSRLGGLSYAWLVVLIGLLLLAILLWLGLKKKQPILLYLLLIVILGGVILVFYLGRTKTSYGPLAKSVSGLQSGKAYYWKVIAEDGKGGTVESETRRFEIK
ncbi:MAG: hypothetical protein AABN95_02010 [Acidobacteriota bacterium]